MIGYVVAANEYCSYPDTGQQHGDVDVAVVDRDESSDGRSIADSFDDRLDRLSGHSVDLKANIKTSFASSLGFRKK